MSVNSMTLIILRFMLCCLGCLFHLPLSDIVVEHSKQCILFCTILYDIINDYSS